MVRLLVLILAKNVRNIENFEKSKKFKINKMNFNVEQTFFKKLSRKI